MISTAGSSTLDTGKPDRATVKYPSNAKGSESLGSRGRPGEVAVIFPIVVIEGFELSPLLNEFSARQLALP